MKNLATMESSILHELAAFDINKPIDFSISFEEYTEAEEVTIKTEEVIDDDKTISKDTNETHNFSEPKKEIEEEVNTNKHLEQNISKEINTFQTDFFQIRTVNSDDERKRKQKLLQIYENKRSKKELTQENVPNNLSIQNKENETLQSLPNSNANFAHQDVDTSQLKNEEMKAEEERKKKASYITCCLTAVSDNMRLVMEAYVFHKQHNTPYDCFKTHKTHLFNESYNTVEKIILPEIKKKKFILDFIDKTYVDALARSPLCKWSHRDFATLFKELLDWAEKKKREAQKARQQENTVQPTLTGSNCCQGPVVENTQVHSSNNRTGADTICIFSAGPPGNEISINIDPNLNQRPSTTNNFKNNEASFIQTPKQSSVNLSQTKMPFRTQPGTQANNKNKHLQELLQRSPQKQPSFPGIVFPRSMLSTQTLPQNQQSVNIADRRSTHAPPSYDQATRLPPWSQLWQQPVQSSSSLFQSIHPRYDQSKHIQQYGQPQHHNYNMLPQFGQYQQFQSQIGQLQNIQPQNGQIPTRQTQSIPSQLVSSHSGQLPQHVSSHSGQPLQHVSPHSGQPPPVLPECERPLQIGEWHQGLNELYQQQIHKNAPRSTSTDSGFISPLNFNTSSDQTVPPAPDHTESSPILITHVTSLNPKVPLIAEGNCVMCNKTTKKVCMGCMKIYYCTYECQLQDWPKHGPDCNNQRTATTLE